MSSVPEAVCMLVSVLYDRWSLQRLALTGAGGKDGPGDGAKGKSVECNGCDSESKPSVLRGRGRKICVYYVYSSAETHGVMENKNDTSSFDLLINAREAQNVKSHLLKVLCAIRW